MAKSLCKYLRKMTQFGDSSIFKVAGSFPFLASVLRIKYNDINPFLAIKTRLLCLSAHFDFTLLKALTLRPT